VHAQKNIFQDQMFTGLPAIKTDFMKGLRSKRQKVKIEIENSDSDEEWTPSTQWRKSSRASRGILYN